MFLFGLMRADGGFDPLILLVAALIIDAAIGDLRFLVRLTGHPLDPFAGLAAWFDRKLNRETRSEGDRAARGAAVVVILVALGLAVGIGVTWLTQNVPAAWAFETLLLVILVPVRSIFTHVRDVGRALRDGDAAGARRQLRAILDRVPGELDDFAVARSAIEVCAERFSAAVVAPVFWFVLFGFPGFLVFQIVNALARQIGLGDAHYRAFGFTAARLNYVLTLIPAWIGALLLALAALFVPTARPGKAFALALSPGVDSSLLVIAAPLGAMAGALGLSLTAARPFEAGAAPHWIGADGRARVTPQDVRRALYLYAAGCLLTTVAVAGVAVLRFA